MNLDQKVVLDWVLVMASRVPRFSDTRLQQHLLQHFKEKATVASSAAPLANDPSTDVATEPVCYQPTPELFADQYVQQAHKSPCYPVLLSMNSADTLHATCHEGKVPPAVWTKPVGVSRRWADECDEETKDDAGAAKDPSADVATELDGYQPKPESVSPSAPIPGQTQEEDDEIKTTDAAEIVGNGDLNGHQGMDNTNFAIKGNKQSFKQIGDQSIAGGDTTLMLRNIPNKVQRKDLMNALDEKFNGQYDFLYLPFDWKSDFASDDGEVLKKNKGFAFVNFTTPEAANRFRCPEQSGGFEGKKLDPSATDKKICSICSADTQTFDVNVKFFRKKCKKTPQVHKDLSPIMFAEGPAGTKWKGEKACWRLLDGNPQIDCPWHLL